MILHSIIYVNQLFWEAGCLILIAEQPLDLDLD